MDVLVTHTCLECHDSDPWIHSPFVDQVGVVPAAVRGRPYVDLAGGVPPPVVSLDGNACTACHDLGAGASCNAYLGWSVGRVTPPSASASAARYPGSHSMPPTSRAPIDEATWTASYGPAVDALVDACASAQAQAGAADP